MSWTDEAMREVPGADQPLDSTDVAVLSRIAHIVSAIDPVPDGLVERSLFAMTLAGLEAEVMDLQLIETPAGSVRGAASPLEARTITFTHERLTVMIALSPAEDGERVRVDGWVAPAGDGVVVELRQPGVGQTGTAAGTARTTATRTDDDGRFVFESVERGQASLLVRPADNVDAPAVTTPVVEL